MGLKEECIKKIERREEQNKNRNDLKKKRKKEWREYNHPRRNFFHS